MQVVVFRNMHVQTEAKYDFLVNMHDHTEASCDFLLNMHTCSHWSKLWALPQMHVE